jgi:hypothetical protein
MDVRVAENPLDLQAVHVHVIGLVRLDSVRHVDPLVQASGKM